MYTRKLQAPHAGLSIKWHEETIKRMKNSVSLLTHGHLYVWNSQQPQFLSLSLTHLILIGILHQISKMLIIICKPS